MTGKMPHISEYRAHLNQHPIFILVCRVANRTVYYTGILRATAIYNRTVTNYESPWGFVLLPHGSCKCGAMAHTSKLLLQVSKTFLA